MNLKNKKVLITGATGGIGNSLVKKFFDSGSIVLATGTNQEKLDNIKKNYNNVIIERFKLDEHQKIESFIDQVHTEATYAQRSRGRLTWYKGAARLLVSIQCDREFGAENEGSC